LDSRQKFVLLYALVSMIPLSVFTLLNVTDIGIFASSFVIIYFVLRLVLNPRIRTRVDYLSLVLLGIFVYFVSERVIAILHP
jgi:hypothetical protein